MVRSKHLLRHERFRHGGRAALCRHGVPCRWTDPSADLSRKSKEEFGTLDAIRGRLYDVWLGRVIVITLDHHVLVLDSHFGTRTFLHFDSILQDKMYSNE